MDAIAYLGATPWLQPRDIPAINEDEEALWPLEGRLMILPILEGDEFGLMPREVPGPIEPELAMARVPSDWPVYDTSFHLGVDEENQDWQVYADMDYLDVQVVNQELWDAQHDEEEEEQEPELEEEILIANAVFRQGPVQISHSIKHRTPMDDDKQLIRNISSSSAEPHIATISMKESPMPDATPPVFVATLERVDLQLARRQ